MYAIVLICLGLSIVHLMTTVAMIYGSIKVKKKLKDNLVHYLTPNCFLIFFYFKYVFYDFLNLILIIVLVLFNDI